MRKTECTCVMSGIIGAVDPVRALSDRVVCAFLYTNAQTHIVSCFSIKNKKLEKKEITRALATT